MPTAEWLPGAQGEVEKELADAEYNDKTAIVWARQFRRKAKDAEARVGGH